MATPTAREHLAPPGAHGREATAAVTTTPDVSVVVPVFNAEATLAALTERLAAVFADRGLRWELVLVDDGSRDASWRVIGELRAAGAPIRAFQFTRNHGQHYALKCGLDHAAGDLVVTMDDDLQHPPEEVPVLLDAIADRPEADVVVGRYHVKQHSLIRNLGSRALQRLERRIFRVEGKLFMGSFRVMRRRVVDEIRQVRHAQPRIGPILLSITHRIEAVDVRHEPRRHGRSGYTLRKLVRDTLDSVMNYSALPLQIVSAIGLGTAFLSFALMIVYLAFYLAGGIAVSGFTTIVLLILFTSGAVLFSFGLVGEYLRRIVSQQLLAAPYHIRLELPAPAGREVTSRAGTPPATAATAAIPEASRDE